ncbi:uncharacterized protein EI97DRAFT_462065 [Westerdykella ornata]|uniref:Uncharacterized protein n=1 Tax=Westerdykella ornata TaxID=318751 RepID=A0A6A6J8E5_WESOR|nr:uncharacterized protein EI97DRAFT_462065 [Westerdykella ornata]KAF2272278.1 hypothetical protein EI97DRAFT_462065 [Westerdykella ornata]
MPVNWQDPEVRDRLLAAIIASFDGKINCREVARLFGKDATYNTIENFLRKPKKFAQQLKEEAGDAPAPSPARPKTPKTPRTPKTPKSAIEGVKSGRITKTSPLKKSKKAQQEESDMEEDTMTAASDGTDCELV